jgi:hypothetical protein
VQHNERVPGVDLAARSAHPVETFAMPSLFAVFRYLLVTFVLIYLGAWLVAAAGELLRHCLGHPRTERHTRRESWARLITMHVPHLRRDALEVCALVAVLGFLIALHR